MATTANAEIESRVAELRRKVSLLREKTIQTKIAQLSRENSLLKVEIEQLKGKYKGALVSSGKCISLLASSVTDSKEVEVSPEPKVEDASPKKTKKEKSKTPVANANKSPAAVGNEKSFDVSKLDLRIGYIREVSRHPDADTLYVEQIECGDQPGNEGGFGETRTVCSGLVSAMGEKELNKRLVVVMCNLKPAKMRGITSQGMVMCACPADGSKPELLDPPPGAKAGDRVVCKEYPGEPDTPFMNPKKKVWESLKPDLKVDSHGVVRFKDAPLEVDGKGLLTSKTNRNCPVT